MNWVSNAPSLRQNCHLSPFINLNSTVYSSCVSSMGFSGPLTLLRLSEGSQGWSRQKGGVTFSASPVTPTKFLTNKKLHPSVIFIAPLLRVRQESRHTRSQATKHPQEKTSPKSIRRSQATQEFSSPMNAARAFFFFFFPPFRAFPPDHMAPESTWAARCSQQPKQGASAGQRCSGQSWRAGCCTARCALENWISYHSPNFFTPIDQWRHRKICLQIPMQRLGEKRFWISKN